MRAGGRVDRVLIAQNLKRSDSIEEIRRVAHARSVPLRVVPRSEIEGSVGAVNHQGVIAFTGAHRYADLENLLRVPSPAILFLDKLTDPQNLGSLLRSADGAGFNGVVIPARESAGITPVVKRVAAGAAEVVEVARVTNLSRAIDLAREAGLWIYGLDGGADRDIWSAELHDGGVGLVLGAEGKGLSPGIRKHCDDFLRIPLAGRLESMNVAVAGAIAMFEVARQRRAWAAGSTL